MGVEPPAGALTPCRVGRIREDHRARHSRELLEQPHTVGFAEVDTLGVRADLAQARRDSLRVPAGGQPLAALAGAAQRRARGQNPSAAGAIEHQRAEAPIQRLVRLGPCQRFHGLARGLKFADPLAQLGAVIQGGLPKGGHVSVELGQQTALDQTLHHRRQRDDGAAAEGLDQQLRLGVQTAEPGADVRHQPGLAARIAQRAALGHRRDVGGGNRRVREIGLGHRIRPSPLPGPHEARGCGRGIGRPSRIRAPRRPGASWLRAA